MQLSAASSSYHLAFLVPFKETLWLKKRNTAKETHRSMEVTLLFPSVSATTSAAGDETLRAPILIIAIRRSAIGKRAMRR